MNTFKCPECGSTEVGSQLYVSPDPSSYHNVDDPWSHVLQQIECGNCNNCIPSHVIRLVLRRWSGHRCIFVGSHRLARGPSRAGCWSLKEPNNFS